MLVPSQNEKQKTSKHYSFSRTRIQKTWKYSWKRYIMNVKELRRFQKKIELDILTGCWLWRGGITEHGYARFYRNRRIVAAHRVSYEHWNGTLSSNLVLDHLCRNRHCVNPQHLEQVTLQENIHRGINPAAQNLRKTHCPEGHPYSGENLIIEPTKRRLNDGRRCKICSQIRTRNYHNRRKEKST